MMLGASRNSLSELSGGLDDRRGAEGLEGLASDLFAVADLLGREKTLRTALADSGQSADSRSQLARTVLEGRVSPLALDVVERAARCRWSSDMDLVFSLESLGDQAAFMVADARGDLDATEEEIFRFGRAVDASPDLQMALTDPSLSASAKSAIVDDLLKDRSTAATRQVLGYAVGHLHGRRIDSVVDGLADAAAQQRQRIVAEVRVARPLDAEQERRLSEALSKLKGRRVRLNVAVDPAVLGGVHVTVGEEVIDGTVASRMEQARRTLLG
ncbi:MAG: F0F1 ATP synthase subunit delta [Candidatus Nanopelagicales bacterium]